MDDISQYRLSENHKREIAQNLIDILQKDAKITVQTKVFIYNWILSGPDEKTKAFFDIWDIVLKNYLPTKRPILFRACERVSKNGKIASFTGCIESARRFSMGRGSLIICDTKKYYNLKKNFISPVSMKIHFIPCQCLRKRQSFWKIWIFSRHIGLYS